MDKVQKQRSNIVLYREKKDGEQYIRIEYAGDPAIALLLAQDTDVEKTDNGSAYMTAAAFKLPDFYDRYSPHAYIDYSRVYVRHPKPQRTYVLPEGYLELLEQKRYSPSTVKTYRAYFSDFMEYHKGRSIDRLKVADINKYILYLVNEKKISVSQQNMRINAIKFYYEQVKGGKRQYYGGITRAKEYKTLPEVLSRDEVKRILSCLTNRKHHCMISLIYSAGLRRSELLNLTPQDIVSERMLVRIMGKGKKCRYSLLSEKVLHEHTAALGMPKLHIQPRWAITAVLLPLAVTGCYLLLFRGTFVRADMRGGEVFSTLSAGIAFTSIAAGFVEEMVFRGVILNLFTQRWNKVVAVIVPSLLFGIVHILGADFTLGSCLLVILAGTMVGVMFSLIALQSGSVWNSGIVHAVWNIVIIGGGLSIGEAADAHAVVSYVLESDSFAVTGGQFGIEASVISLAGYCIVAAIAYAQLRADNEKRS